MSKKKRYLKTDATRASKMTLIGAALARCRRDAEGRLKLGDLWRIPAVGHNNLSHAIKRAGLAAHVVTVGAGRNESRGLFAPEGVARQLAELSPPEHLWTGAVPCAPEPLASADQETRRAAPRRQNVSREVSDGEVGESASAADLGSQLSTLLGHPVNFHLRATPDNRPALIDITMIFTGLKRDQAGLVVRRLLEEHPEVRSSISNFKFPGPGQRPTSVAPMSVALEYAFLLPGKAAAQMRRQAAKLVVRYLGGDVTLVDEVYTNRRAQESLASIPAEQRTPQEHAARFCGEAVENQVQSLAASAERLFVPRKPMVIQDQEAVGLPGSDHLYAAARQGENLIKIGVSKDVLQRLRELAQSFGGQYELLAVWPNEAVLEGLVLEILKSAKASVGSSREHFNANASFEQICQVVVAARHLHKTRTELDTAGCKRKNEDVEFQEELAERALRRRKQEAQFILLHDLVRQGDKEAKRVFLASLM